MTDTDDPAPTRAPDPLVTRLQEKGHAWRDSLGAAPDASQAAQRLLLGKPAGQIWRRSSFAIVGAAALVVAITVGVVILTRPATPAALDSPTALPDQTSSPVTSVASSADITSLTVENGSNVIGRGIIQERSFKGGYQLCAPQASAISAVGGTGGPSDSRKIDNCLGSQLIATLKPAPGVTLPAGPDMVEVNGTYRDGSIAVDAVFVQTDTPLPVPTTPCLTPQGGWKPLNGLGTVGDIGPLSTYLANNPDEYAGLWISQPSNAQQYPTDVGGKITQRVIAVGTTGDVTAARATLASHYAGPICVVTAKFSRTDLASTVRSLQDLAGDQTVGPVEIDPATDSVTLTLRALTPNLLAKIRPQLASTTIRSWIWPASITMDPAHQATG